jgi:hypothetical protein
VADQTRPRTAVAIDPGVFDRYVGYYAFHPRRLVFIVTRDGDRFFGQVTGETRVEYFPESETSYFAKTAPLQITFVTGAHGPATGLVLHSVGRDFPARRADAAEVERAEAEFDELARRRADQERPRTAVAVDPQSQDRYVGFYEANAQNVFTITRAGDQLFAQSTGQPSFPIFAEREGGYFYKTAAAQLTFVADRQGRVNELVLHQSGSNFRAARIGDIPAADRTAAVDPATFDKFVGSYEAPYPWNIVTVTREGSRLFVQEAGQAKVEIIARSASGYTASGGGTPGVVFEPAVQGPSPALILYDETRGAARAGRIDAARARQIVAVESRQRADAPERFLRQQPAPGSEAALRHHYETWTRGAPDYDRMTPRFAELIRQQITGMMNNFTALGAVEAATFKGVGPGGYDVYDVKLAHGMAQIRVSLAADGKLQGLLFRGDGDGSPGAVVACSEEDKLRPAPGGAPIRMTFANHSGGEIRVFRPDFLGKRIRVATILDDEAIPTVEANVTRPLMVTDAAEHCLQIILPGTDTQHVVITSSAPAGASGDKASPRNTPLPGGEAALRHLIDGIRRGQPDYTRMTPPAQHALRRSVDLYRDIMTRAGAVQAISFAGVGSAGEDSYLVRYENGSAEMRIDLMKDGRIRSVSLGPK